MQYEGSDLQDAFISLEMLKLCYTFVLVGKPKLETSYLGSVENIKAVV